MLARIALFLICLSCIPVPARAVSIDDIIALTQGGLSDTVLIALIDADRTIFELDAKQVLALRDAGVSETVLLRMIQSRQRLEVISPENSSGPDLAPSLMIAGGASPSLQSSDASAVVVPYYIPAGPWLPPWQGGHVPGGPAEGFGKGLGFKGPFVRARQPRGFGRFINDGWIGETRVVR